MFLEHRRNQCSGGYSGYSHCADFLFGNQPGERLFDLLGTGGNRIHNSLDIGCHQFISLTNLGKALGSVNKQNIRFFFWRSTIMIVGIPVPKKMLAGQANNRLNIVVLNQISANLSFAFT